MGLFAQDPGAPAARTPLYAKWTREVGTRKLIYWFVGLLAAWYLFGRIQDHFLLQKTWPPLASQPEGLSVVGTLDSKDYDHNLFRVVNANLTSRVEITDYGWNTIFDDKNGAIYGQKYGDIIKAVQGLDSETSYRMLEPYLRAGLAHFLGHDNWSGLASLTTPVTVQIPQGNSFVSQNTTLGDLMHKYSAQHAQKDEDTGTDASEGGSENGHSVEHGMIVPADSLINSCPIVLNGSSFTGAEIEERPATMFEGKTYTVTLYLTGEGRSRFYQWSSQHENENLLFVLKHRVVASGRVVEKLNVNFWQVGPLHDEASATALCSFVNGKK